METRDDKTGRKRREQIWPRYHQMDVVRRLLADASIKGFGPKYLIQHPAGSGKSNSIAWLAHQLIGLEQDGTALFDSAIVVTDRRILDKQIRDTIKQFAQVGSVVGHAESSSHLRTLLQDGKRIVITTVQKFPLILDAIGNEHRGRKFAIIIDEAHSSQGGRTSASVSMALREAGSEGEEETTEDKINRLMESKKLLPNASYFAFTATPKNKTLEIFGDPSPEGGNTRHLSLYREQLDEDGQMDFKGKAKAFLRIYGFLAAILPYANAEWEKLSIFLTFLVPKLPAPIEDDLSKGILEAMDMDSYRVEKQAVRDIQLPDEDAEIEPVSTSGGGQQPEPEMERLSNIIRELNDRFGNIDSLEKSLCKPH